MVKSIIYALGRWCALYCVLLGLHEDWPLWILASLLWAILPEPEA